MKGNKIWNDPEWRVLRKRANDLGVPAHSIKSTKINNMSILVDERANTSISTNDAGNHKKVSLTFKIPKIKPPQLSSKQSKIALASAGIIGISIISSYVILNRGGNREEPRDVLSETSQLPSFDTILPDGKEGETTSGKIGYDPERKVASYTDKIGTTAITVSQQELPEKLKENPDEEVRKIAESFSVTEVINESNPRAYLGNDVEGPQTVIFHKNGLLVFILSSKMIEKDEWAQYITNLL